ncbi:MAG: TRAP transporter permease [Alphaproteobacteria bacterium]|nr:TRAP transporter permease [Alphaproteobacteria bacterium]
MAQQDLDPAGRRAAPAQATSGGNGGTETVPAAPEVDDVEFATTRRDLHGVLGQLFRWGGIAFVAFHLYVLLLHPMDPLVYRTIHVYLGAIFGLGLFVAYQGDKVRSIPWFDWVLFAGALFCVVYVAWESEDMMFRAGVMTTTGDMVAAIIGIVVLLEFTRRTAGAAMPIIAIVFMAYYYIGPWLPGVLYHQGISVGDSLSFVFSIEGIQGTIVGVSSTFIVMFVTLAGFLQVSRAGEYFNDLAAMMVGWARGGPAKVAVVASSMFGAISGSAVANVVASGTFTIPMMKRAGYDGATAGAVEATASTGGQIMPPVMGAGAFIMAEILGKPYAEIAFAGIIPAVLYYLACFAHADLHALKIGMRGLPRAQLPGFVSTMSRLYLLTPLLILIWALMQGFSPFRAASLGIALCLLIMAGTYFFHTLLVQRRGPVVAVTDTLARLVSAIAEALYAASRETLQLIAVCGTAGIIGAVILQTGIGGRLANLLLQIAGDLPLLGMVFAMVVALVLGMGVPTTAAYAIGAAVLGPGLTRLGIEPLVVHFFIFYFAVLSSITPPVALASFAAAGLAKADMWKTSMIALKRGFATFIVPYMFFFSPALLGQGSLVEVLHVFITASLGVYLLACATEGQMFTALSKPERAVALVSAFSLIVPELITDLIGLGGGAGVFLYQRLVAYPRARALR